MCVNRKSSPCLLRVLALRFTGRWLITENQQTLGGFSDAAARHVLCIVTVSVLNLRSAPGAARYLGLLGGSQLATQRYVSLPHTSHEDQDTIRGLCNEFSDHGIHRALRDGAGELNAGITAGGGEPFL